MTLARANAATTDLPGQPWELEGAARFLRISSRHLRRLIDLGKVKCIRLGRRKFIPDGEVVRLANEGVS